MESRITQKEDLVVQLQDEKKRVLLDYDDYKKRATQILKEQKANQKSQHEQDADKQRISELAAQVESASEQLGREQDRQRQRDSQMATLRQEHDHLAEKYGQLMGSYNEETVSLKQRIQVAAKELTAIKEQHSQEVTSLQAHTKAIKESYRQQGLLDKQKRALDMGNYETQMEELGKSYSEES